jgi:hypothetical protein
MTAAPGASAEYAAWTMDSSSARVGAAVCEACASAKGEAKAAQTASASVIERMNDTAMDLLE